jgi:TolB-like protein/class 3 adenylate cyclase/Tfp pilus assembly protein PilF
MVDQDDADKPRLERRMLAIMATDVVGFSRQMEHDEVGTIARVNAARVEVIEPLLARHHGRLIKLMGDGTLSVFDSVVDAVNCAAAIQRAAAERNQTASDSEHLVMRIGVNLGDVVLQDNDVYGDGVNVAARLEPLCDPGGIMISGTAFDHLQGKVDFPLEFAGEQQVKNISRPVRAYRARLDGIAEPPPVHRRRFSLPLRPVAAVATAALLAVGGWWVWSGWSAPPANASIAVLPFDNLGGDDATGRLADGMTEDLITDLTRYRDLDVIARDATLVYKDKAVDVRQVGQALHVLYVLDGAVQRQGERVRISARLIDTNTARDVWSERWDRTTDDVFAVQSELAEAVASKIASPYSGEIIAADREAAKRKPPKNLNAYDLYLLGMEAQGRGTREGLEEAIQLLQRSLAIDPNFARAWTGLAVTYAGLADMRDYPADIQQAREAAARKAVALDPADAQAHAALATYYMDIGETARGEAEFEKALRLNPGSADLLATYAGWASNFGKPDRGVAYAERAMRLNPDTPPWAMYNFAYAYFMDGRYADALRAFDRMPAEAYSPSAYIYRAATLGALGEHDNAKQAVRQAMAQNPDLTIETWVDGHASNAAERERLVTSMRAAGFPVCGGPDAIKAVPGLKRLPECATS